MSLRPAVLLLAVFSVLPPAVRGADEAEGPPKIAGVDVPAPKRTKSVRPQYPPEAQAVGMRGIVILELLVGPDGKVTSAKVTRSVPPFDDAALAAVQQWEYEITKVEGKPVSVLITVPIEFKMNMPEMAREEGIPELRQGVGPAFPAGATEEAATVTAEVTVDPDGHVAEAHVKSGESPWAEALIQALRTWRFTPLEGQTGLAFDVKAEFSSGGKGPHVALKLTGPKRIDAPASASAASPEPAAAPAPSPAVAQAAPPAPMPSPVAAPAAPASPAATPVPSPAATAPAASPPPEEVIRNPAGGPPVPPHLPAAGPASPAPGAPASGPDVAASPGATPASPAAAPPPLSAVRDVTLAAGVPDLIRGRRPVSPPLARMQGLSGTVDVNFAVDASGSASVREVTGPDSLKEAARQTVASWVFRRATTERIFLAATFVYKGDTASVAVKSQE